MGSTNSTLTRRRNVFFRDKKVNYTYNIRKPACLRQSSWIRAETEFLLRYSAPPCQTHARWWLRVCARIRLLWWGGNPEVGDKFQLVCTCMPKGAFLSVRL